MAPYKINTVYSFQNGSEVTVVCGGRTRYEITRSACGQLGPLLPRERLAVLGRNQCTHGTAPMQGLRLS